jgi:hypothetical protein
MVRIRWLHCADLVATLENRAGIHKACLRKQIGLRVDSLQTLFTDPLFGVYPSFYRTDLSTLTVQTHWWIFSGNRDQLHQQKHINNIFNT